MPSQFRESADRQINSALLGIVRRVEAGEMSPEDGDVLQEYVIERSTQISPERTANIASGLCVARRYFPRYSGATKNDFLRGYGGLKHATKANGAPYAANTRADLLTYAKMFFVWLIGRGYADLPVDVVRSAKVTPGNLVTKSEDDVLTADEVTRLIGAAKSVRYKALISVMYEAGLRSIEAANLRWRDVTFHAWGARIRTDAKTGKPRSVPVIMYRELLANWRASYPGDPTGDHYVFLSHAGRPLKYGSLRRAVNRFAADAGIEKRIGLHNLRHSRITHVLRDGMQETLAKKAFWGNQSTAMITTYAHLVDQDLDREFSRLAGVDLPDDIEANGAPEPVQCPTCHLVMPPGSRFCGRCGMTLTVEAAETVNTVIKAAEAVVANPNDPEALTILLEARAKMARGG